MDCFCFLAVELSSWPLSEARTSEKMRCFDISANSIGVFSIRCSFKLFIYFNLFNFIFILSSQTFINRSVQNTFKFAFYSKRSRLIFQWQFFESSVEVDTFQKRAARTYLRYQLSKQSPSNFHFERESRKLWLKILDKKENIECGACQVRSGQWRLAVWWQYRWPSSKTLLAHPPSTPLGNRLPNRPNRQIKVSFKYCAAKKLVR